MILETDSPQRLSGHGLAFTIGRGNEICVAAVGSLSHLLVGHTLEDIVADMGAFWRHLTGDSQLRWLGPEKGVIHLAAGALVNALWDLWAKSEQKPVWRLLSDLEPEKLVRCLDFGFVSDALTPEEAIAILRRNVPTKAAREAEMRKIGFPAYTTSAGWLGYSDDKLRRLAREALGAGWDSFKLKVGGNIEDDGSIMVRPGAPFQVQAFAEDGGEGPEIAGLYVIAPDGAGDGTERQGGGIVPAVAAAVARQIVHLPVIADFRYIDCPGSAAHSPAAVEPFQENGN